MSNVFTTCFFVLAWGLTTWAHAGDMAECAKIEDKDKRNYCMANYAASGTYCDMIKSYEMRRDCMSKVVQKQRELSYKVVKKPKPTEEESK
jgi:hypothetical protein